MMLENLDDHELVANLSDLLVEEQERLVSQLEYLAELDRRKLFFEHSSLWSYLVHEHQMEEATAERRIRAARVMRRFPWIKNLLNSGKLNISLLEMAQSVATREKLSDEEFSEAIHSGVGMSCLLSGAFLCGMLVHSTSLDWSKIPEIYPVDTWPEKILYSYLWLLKQSVVLGFWCTPRTTGLSTLFIAGFLYVWFRSSGRYSQK